MQFLDGAVNTYLSIYILLTLYKSLIVPHLDYCDIIWDVATVQCKNKLQVLQNKALRIINKTNWRTPVQELHTSGKLPMLDDRRKYHLDIFMYKVANDLLPGSITHNFTFSNSVHSHATRAAQNAQMHIPTVNLNYGKHTIIFRGSKRRDSLPPEIKQLPS